jgi:soluble P-type ATPase
VLTVDIPGWPSVQLEFLLLDVIGRLTLDIGSGANDADMLREAALGIAVVGPEGLAGGALPAADVVVASINDALGLLVNSKRVIATLRR